MKKKEDIGKIYAAALSAFAEFGYKKTTVEDVAKRLGMTKGNLYLYVRNKRELYDQTASYALSRWQGLVFQRVEREQNVRQKFLVMCRKAVDYLSDDRDLKRLLARDPGIFPMFQPNDPFAEINNASKALVRRILEQGIAEGKFRAVDPDRVSEVIFSIYKMFVIRVYLKEENEEVLKMFDDTVELMTTGLFLENGDRDS